MSGLDISAAGGLLTPIVDKQLHSVLYSFDNAKLNPGFVSMQRAQAKQSDFGEGWQVSVEIGAMGATSATYSVAHANMGIAPPTVKKFIVTPATIFTKGKLEGAVIDRCKDQGGLVQAMAFVAKSTMKNHMRKLCVLSTGNGTASLGRITAVNASPAYIDVTPGAARRIELNDMLVAAAAESTGGLRSATSIRVIGRSTSLNRIFLSADPTGLSWSASSGGDYLFWEGCRNLVFKGQTAWAPSVDPVLGTDSFFNVDRGIDPVRLGGNRSDCAGKTYSKALLAAGLASAAESAPIKRVRMSVEDYSALCEERDDLKTIELTGENTTIGFSGVRVAGGPTGKFDVLPDESFLPGDGMMEDDSTWQCLSTDGTLARIEKADGLLFRAIAGEYAYEMAVISVIQMVNVRPGHVTRLFNLGTP